MKNKIFTGACTAIITPMTDGKIDYRNLDRLIEFQIENGISAITVSGTTGESSTLSYREHRDLIKHTVKRVNGRIPLIAGAGSNDTEKAVKMTKYVCDYGADAILAVTPYYNKTNQQGLLSHYEKISDASEKPIIIYNVPGRTCVNILPETYRSLAQIEKICGIKEAATNLSDSALVADSCPDIALYSGNDDLLIPMLSIGASGVISVMSNIFPKISVNICKLFFDGKTEEALLLYRKYLNFARMLFCDVNPIPIKHIMSYAGMCSPELRLPLVSASKNISEKLESEYKLLTEQ